MDRKRKEFDEIGFSGEASLEETQLIREIRESNEVENRKQIYKEQMLNKEENSDDQDES